MIIEAETVKGCTLTEVMLDILNLSRDFYADTGLTATHFIALFKRTTRIKIPESPVEVQDEEFRIVGNPAGDKNIISVFCKVYLETHRSMMALWGPRVISFHYTDLYHALEQKYGRDEFGKQILSCISPDKLVR